MSDLNGDYLRAMRGIVAADVTIHEVIELAARLSAAGQRDAAHKLYRAWIGANADHPLLYIVQFNCAALETERGARDEAIALLTAAIERNPKFLAAYVNLSNAYEQTGRVAEALEALNSAVNQNVPLNGMNVAHATTVYRQLTRIYSDLQQTASAEDAVAKCLEISPSQTDALEQLIAFRLAQCKWPVMQPLDRISKDVLMKSIHPLSMAVYTDDPALHLAAADRFVRTQPLMAPGAHDRRNALIPLDERRLRIGYVSSDLRDHAVGYLMAELFECHDASAFEIFAYYCGPESKSPLANRIQAAVEHWTSIRSMDDDAAAARIAADGIDILIDVNGHTRDARPGVFARRPAPVQVNWLGFPGSMGTPYHQYIVADDTIIPTESEKYYSERVVRLPCYQPNDRKRMVGRTPSRAEAGLPEDAFVYCCFNGIHKISRFTFDRWMEVLRRTNDSVLWLLSPQPETQSRMAAAAEAQGVSGSRLIFAPRLNNADHLARYPLADLFLDTSPYGAHTTASDALWMCVPVVTVLGRGFASRVCGSLVRAAGLPELVANSGAEYVELAVSLYSRRDVLRGFQERLRAERDRCVLFDTPVLARSLETLYWQMALEARAGRLPVPDLTNLDAYLEVGASFDHDAADIGASSDYEGMYRTALARRHLARPLPPDRRLWTHAVLEDAERAFAVAWVERERVDGQASAKTAQRGVKRAS